MPPPAAIPAHAKLITAMPHIIPSLTKLIPAMPHVITLRAKITPTLSKVTPHASKCIQKKSRQLNSRSADGTFMKKV